MGLNETLAIVEQQFDKLEKLMHAIGIAVKDHTITAEFVCKETRQTKETCLKLLKELNE